MAGGIRRLRGLQRRFDAARVFDTPIAERDLGSAVGAAMAGLQPVVRSWATLLVALDPLVNRAAVRYVSRGELQAPLVVRTQRGVTPGCARSAQSSRRCWRTSPASARAAGHASGRVRDAARGDRDPDPCVLFEARAVQEKGDAARRVADGGRWPAGDGVAIVTWGTMVAPASPPPSSSPSRGGSGGARPALAGAARRRGDRHGRRGDRPRARAAGERRRLRAEVAARIHERCFDARSTRSCTWRAGHAGSRRRQALQRALIPTSRRSSSAAAKLAGASSEQAARAASRRRKYRWRRGGRRRRASSSGTRARARACNRPPASASCSRSRRATTA